MNLKQKIYQILIFCCNFKKYSITFESMLTERKKEKCERSQLWSMDWCGERPFGHRAAHHLLVTNSLS